MAAGSGLPPIVEAERVLAQVRAHTDKIVVMVSGGKESLATLDACVRVFKAPNVIGVLMELVKGLECEWAPIRRAERRHGIKVIGVPHNDLAKYIKHSTLRPYTPGSEKTRLLKQLDVENYIRRITGFDWFAWGMRATDSTFRNAYLKRCHGVDVKARRAYPLWTFRCRDVYGYLKAKRIPVPLGVGGKIDHNGVNLTVECLTWLRDKHPADYVKVLREFPFAYGQLYRREHFGKKDVTPRKDRAEG